MGFEYRSLATGHFQMPDGWSLSTIQKVAEVNEKAITKRNAPSHIHYIDIASVDKGKLLDIQELPFEKAPSRARRIVRDKDSLIATVRPNLEHYMFVKGPRPNTIASTGFAVVTAKTADPRFLYYYLTSKPFTAYLTQIAESHTSAYPAFNSDVIEKAELVLPSDSEQRAISHILGSLDDKIELNRQMNQTLEAKAQAIFKSWFVDFDPVRVKAEGGDPGLPDDVAALFPDSFEDSELGEIPKGWEVGTLGAICKFKGGSVFKKDLQGKSEGDFPFIKVRDMNHFINERFILRADNYVDEKTKASIKAKVHSKGSIVLAKIGVALTYNRLRILDSATCIDNNMLSVRSKHKEIGEILLFMILSQYDFNFYAKGSALPYLNITDLEKAPVVISPPSVWNSISRHLSPLFYTIRNNAKQNQSLSNLRDTLLPKLISGELRVPDAEKFVEEAGV